LAEKRRGERVDLGVVESDHRNAVVATFQMYLRVSHGGSPYDTARIESCVVVG
jgi:hypothetical protein